MKKILILFFCVISQLQAQTLMNTNWYLTKIEVNNQIDNIPLSNNGISPGNWHFHVYSLSPANDTADLGSTYCSSFVGKINFTTTTFNFLTDIALTLNLPCEWMTNEEIQYFSKYYFFFKSYQNNTFTYLIQNTSGNTELIITNSAGNKAYYGNVPLSNKTFEKIEKELTIYPNPTTTELSIKIPKNEQLNSIKIINTEGKEIKKVYSTVVNVSDLSTGIYFLEIEISGLKYNRKFIKK